jgi:hypothetical protein
MEDDLISLGLWRWFYIEHWKNYETLNGKLMYLEEYYDYFLLFYLIFVCNEVIPFLNPIIQT